MNWFLQTKKTLRKTSYMSWIMKLYPVPVGIITSRLIADVVEEALAGNRKGVLFLGGIALSMLAVIKLLDIFFSIKLQKQISKAKQQCKMELYRRFLENPLHILSSVEHGDSMEKLTDDFNTITGMSINSVPALGAAVFMALAYFLVIAVQNWIIALVLLAISILQIIPPIVIKKYLQINYDNCREIDGKIIDFIVEGFFGFATIKLYNLKSWWIGRLNELHKKYLKIGNKAEITSTADDAITNLVDNILKYGTYAVVGSLVLFQYASLSIGIQTIALSSGFFNAVKMGFSVIGDFAMAKIAKRRLDSWFLPAERDKTSFDSGEIRCSDVSFSYGDKKILSNCSFLIEENRFSVIKGENGIGKSTLFQLMTGMLINFEGDFLVGKKCPAYFSREDFPKKLFYLPQQDVEFDFSANELFQMMFPEKIDEVNRVLKKFQLGKELFEGKKIKELSGGERKKVFLSLALVINPFLLLLDEPTNSLDLEGRETLKRLLAGRRRSTVIITHEDCFDEIADYVFIMADGGLRDGKEEAN